jgi:hypothetical protein
MDPKATTAALALLSIAYAHAGEAVTLTWKKDAPTNPQTSVLTLAAGESARVRYFLGAADSGNPKIEITAGGVTFPALQSSLSNPPEVAGPATVRLIPQSEAAGYIPSLYLMTLEVTRPASPSVTPSNAAVIPADANGTFTVILESSTDLITWTAANPGDYSGNTEKRFFRTRIVKK